MNYIAILDRGHTFHSGQYLPNNVTENIFPNQKRYAGIAAICAGNWAGRRGRRRANPVRCPPPEMSGPRPAHARRLHCRYARPCAYFFPPGEKKILHQTHIWTCILLNIQYILTLKYFTSDRNSIFNLIPIPGSFIKLFINNNIKNIHDDAIIISSLSWMIDSSSLLIIYVLATS
jgi:hypothetical protein